MLLLVGCKHCHNSDFLLQLLCLLLLQLPSLLLLLNLLLLILLQLLILMFMHVETSVALSGKAAEEAPEEAG